jgi:hypothetical protein
VGPACEPPSSSRGKKADMTSTEVAKIDEKLTKGLILNPRKTLVVKIDF